ncbi:MAG: hypothetical protein J7501_13175 [Bdellovibrio sp.]|nr:hypothetical protein [Bdellovibrio sp.]
MKITNFILATMVFVLCLNAQAGLLLNYSQLATKDLDEMNQLVNDKIKESKKSYSGKNVPLKEALQAIYSRPNDDDMIDKIVGPVRTNLDELEAWEKTVSQLTDEAVNALKHTKPFKPVVQVTYAIFLENLMSEMKPFLKDGGFERKIVERIANAKIEITDAAKGERKLRMMKGTDSPSDIATKLLSENPVVAKKVAAPTESSAETSTSQQ